MNSMDLGLLRAHGFVVLARVLDAVNELPGRPWWLRRIALLEPYGGPELMFLFDAPWKDGRHVSTISVRFRQGKWFIDAETCDLGSEQVEHYRLFDAAVLTILDKTGWSGK